MLGVLIKLYRLICFDTSHFLSWSFESNLRCRKRPKVTLAAFVGGRRSRTLVREIIVKYDKGHSSGARMQS